MGEKTFNLISLTHTEKVLSHFPFRGKGFQPFEKARYKQVFRNTNFRLAMHINWKDRRYDPIGTAFSPTFWE